MKDNEDFNYVDTDSVLISNLTPEQIKRAKQIINSFYGKSAGVLQTITQIVDCDFCRNANTCDELQHDNDLSYMSCGNVDNGFRMMFRSGDKRKTGLIVEQRNNKGGKLSVFLRQTIARSAVDPCTKIPINIKYTKEGYNMKLSDVINITENTVIVYAPIYNKDGEEYKNKVIELGRYGRYNRPTDSIKQATVINIESYDADHISVIINV